MLPRTFFSVPRSTERLSFGAEVMRSSRQRELGGSRNSELDNWIELSEPASVVGGSASACAEAARMRMVLARIGIPPSVLAAQGRVNLAPGWQLGDWRVDS